MPNYTFINDFFKPIMIKEHFLGVSVGAEDITETKHKNLTDITKDINRDMVVSAVSNILNKALNDASSTNKAELTKALSASNKIRLSNITDGEGLTITNVTQTAKVDTTTEGEIVQNLSNKMVNDITNNIIKDITQASSDINRLQEEIGTSTNAGQIAADVLNPLAEFPNTLVNAAAGVVNNAGTVNVGESNVNRTEFVNEVKDAFELDENFNLDENNDLKNQLENALSAENLGNCAEQSAAENDISVENIDAGGEILISDIEQEALVNSAMKCAFNQEVLNEMSNSIINNIEQNLRKISESMTEEQREERSGDLYAVGEASAGLMLATGEAVGTASKGLGEGVSTAAKGTGEGVSTAAKGAGEGIASASEGIGKGISGIFSSLSGPLMIFAVVAALGALAFAYFKLQKMNI